MKSHLLAASAAALCALMAPALAPIASGAFAQEDEERNVFVRQGSRVVTDAGVRLDVRSEDGESTVVMIREDGASDISINGREIRVADGAVFIDGERHEAAPGSIVVIEGDTVEIVEGGAAHRQVWVSRGGDAYAFGDHDDALAEAMVRMHAHSGEMGAVHEEIRLAMREAMEELENHRSWDHERWDDLSDEEREEVREAMREAREEMRAAMDELREEMREIEVHRAMGDEARREIRVEIERAAREMAHAERDAARAERDAARRMRWVQRVHREDRDEEFNEEIRVEEDGDGRRRVWVNGEEQTGEDLVEWLNRLESRRFMQDDVDLAGGAHDRRVFAYRFGDDAEGAEGERRVVRRLAFRDENGDIHREMEFGEGGRETMDWVFSDEDGEVVIELDGEVIELHELDGEHVIETEGGRRVIIVREHEEN